jgi:PHP family Zn ribbon phosphoesterase
MHKLHETSPWGTIVYLMKKFRAEFHIHTALSPCAEKEMLPQAIVDTALSLGIDLIAITDHNHTGNFAAVQKAAAGTHLTVLAGAELQTREEVHSLALFDTLQQAEFFQQFIDEKLPNVPNRPDFFGEQFIVDETGSFVRQEERLLANSLAASIEETSARVHALGGIFIPAHVNRKVCGLLANLGSVPSELKADALEISRHTTLKEMHIQYPQTKNYPLIQSGDAHSLKDFLGVNEFTMNAPTIAEIKLALKSRDGRSFHLISHPQNV